MTEKESSPQVYRGLRRETPLPCCILTRDDLRTLYVRLGEKVREGLEPQLAELERPDGFDPNEWEELKGQARDAAQLTAMVFGAAGEQVYATEEDGLLDRNLPDRITSVIFDSATALKSNVNVDARNRFKLTIDFSNPPGFNRYDPTSQPTLNGSVLEVTGPDETWVSGVHELVMQFFKGRETARRLIHSGNIFFAVQCLVVIPGSIWLSYRMVEVLPDALTHAHPVLTTTLYLYGFLLAFITFRLVKLGVRRAWPYVELEGDSKVLGRFFIATATTGLIVAFVYDLLKELVT